MGKTINDMRKYILEAYPNSPKFREKVYKMPNNQIVAIYKSVVARQERGEKLKNQNKEFHQMDIWEYMLDKNEDEHGPGTHTIINLKEDSSND